MQVQPTPLDAGGPIPDAAPFQSIPAVIAAAEALGFDPEDQSWANLGQGQPEHGDIPGAPPRLQSVAFRGADYGYGPPNGFLELRQTIASYYNAFYRNDRRSFYSADNVSVAAGGRVALHRALASLPSSTLGHQIPDYAAFQPILAAQHPRVSTVALDTIAGPLSAEELGREIAHHHLDAFLFSNPCNPTGQVVSGRQLDDYVRRARRLDCRFIIDEFYSHYVFGGTPNAPISAARYVKDVNEDPVVIIDGLTKNFRYPGLRIGWTIGPRDLIAAINDVAAAFDGGPSTISQRAALSILQPSAVLQATRALQDTFAEKRSQAVAFLRDIGLPSDPHANGTFYVWVDIGGLPAPFNEANHFVREALRHRVITLPGTLFDVRPDDAQPANDALSQRVRISCGPEIKTVMRGLQRLKLMLSSTLTERTGS